MTRPAGFTVCLALAAAVAGAQAPVFRSAVDVVQIDVSVTRGNNAVPNLGPADFVVLDNGVRRDVGAASVEQVPLHFVAVLDTSASVRGDVLADLRDGARAAMEALRPGDLASFVVFSHQIVIRRWPAEQAVQAGAFLDGLDGFGATSLYDAIHAATLLPVPPGYRTALLVFSDGQDSASWLSADDAIDSVRRSDAVVHVVSRAGQPRGFLDNLARAGGGRRWNVEGRGDLRQTFLRVLDELRVRYRLTITLPDKPAPGWHELTVTTSARGATVVARPGYDVP